MGEAARPGRWLTGSADRDEVERILTEVLAGPGRRSAPGAPVRRARHPTVADRSAAAALAVSEELAELLPSGLRRGSTVRVTGSVSLLLLLLAGAMADTDRWSAVVGAPSLGLAAAAEFGVPLHRLALVPHPGPDLPAVVGALVDGMSLVAAVLPTGVNAATARTLSGRARSRGCVLVVGPGWPGVDLEIGVNGRRWVGLGQGRGRLRYCEFDVEARGRGAAARPRRAAIRLPRLADADLKRSQPHHEEERQQRHRALGANSSTGSPWEIGPDGLVGLPAEGRRAG